jgi:hypothetical protein
VAVRKLEPRQTSLRAVLVRRAPEHSQWWQPDVDDDTPVMQLTDVKASCGRY